MQVQFHTLHRLVIGTVNAPYPGNCIVEENQIRTLGTVTPHLSAAVAVQGKDRPVLDCRTKRVRVLRQKPERFALNGSAVVRQVESNVELVPVAACLLGVSEHFAQDDQPAAGLVNSGKCRRGHIELCTQQILRIGDIKGHKANVVFSVRRFDFPLLRMRGFRRAIGIRRQGKQASDTGQDRLLGLILRRRIPGRTALSVGAQGALYLLVSLLQKGTLVLCDAVLRRFGIDDLHTQINVKF